jgi:hypothetical protein
LEKAINWGATLFIPILLFLLAPIWGSLFEDQKAIEYSVVGEKQIFDKESFDEEWPELNFSVSGSALSKAFITTIEVRNSGRTPIRTDDFESSIKFGLDIEDGFVNTRIVHSHPENLPVNIEYKEGALFVHPLLLNPNDYFAFEVLTESRIGVEAVVARIVGIDDIKEKKLEAFSGLRIELIEPSDRVGSSSHIPLISISGYGLLAVSLLASFFTFILFFSFQASYGKGAKVIYLILSMSTYVLFILSTRLLPEAYFGTNSARWMDYVSMIGLLLFGAAMALWVRSKLGVIRLTSTEPK